MLKKLLKNKILSGVVLGSLLALICSVGSISKIFFPLHETFSNSLYTYENPSDEIVIIAIDDKSTQPLEKGGLGRFSQWSRERYIELLEVLQKANPKVITFDIIFHTHTTSVSSKAINDMLLEASRGNSKAEELEKYRSFLNSYKYSYASPIDNKFGEKLAEFDNIILAASVNGKEVSKPLTELSSKATIAFASAFLDKSGVFRHIVPTFYFPEEDETYDHLFYATAKKYLEDEDLDLKLENGVMMTNYFGDSYSYEMIPFVDVLNEKFQPETFKNKIVLIGVTSAKEVPDEYYTPRSNIMPMPGVEIIANQIQTVLDGKFLTNQSTLSQIFTLFLISITLSILLNYLGIIAATITALLAILAYLAAAHFMYHRGMIINMVYPFIAIILSYVGSWVYKYFIADKGKREIKSAFGHYVSNELVEQITENPEMAKLGGEKREVTVLFADLKDSTRLSEKSEISNWVAQLNEYFTVMENVIKSHSGTIDKYEGDAIMAFWNAPVLESDHAMKAYSAALEMRKMLTALNNKWAKESRPTLNFRIGINTGEVIVGNIGSKDRFNYTVMGDTVNTASRLESSANKAYGTSLAIGGFETSLTIDQRENFIYREIDRVILPGKSEAIAIFEVLALKSEAVELQKLADDYSKALELYRNAEFAKAAEYLKMHPEDNPSAAILARCEALLSGKTLPELDENMNFRILNK